MLGKTNLTTVEKGTIISDIADYNWNNVRVDGIHESFVRTIYANNVLVAITKGGIVAYTKDGENWETKAIELDNGDYFEFTDIVYGNGKYMIVGYHTDKETYMHGLIAITEDLIDYDVITNAENTDYFEAGTTCVKFLGVSAGDGNFTIFYFGSKRDSKYTSISLYAAIVNFKNKANINQVLPFSSVIGDGFLNFSTIVSDAIFKLNKKTDGGTILYYRFFVQTSYHNGVYVSKDSTSFKRLTDGDMEGGNTGHKDYNMDLFSLFECKDSLYFNANTADFNYDVTKIIGDSDEAVMTTGIPYGFLDAAYFNKCEVWVNRHEMLIVYPKEKIADKSLDDLIDITYDFSIISIVKAFNKLYIFGTGGNILVSNNEANNEEAIAIKSMSASKALYDAKAYTDKKIEELRAELTNGL